MSTLINSPSSAHCTPASWAWEHPVIPRYFIAFLHSNSEFSVPLQMSFVSHIGRPRPPPNVEPWNNSTAFEKFNIRHATWPSLMVHRSSQTVPHSPKWKTSTRPIELDGPPTRRTTGATMENEEIFTPLFLKRKDNANQNSSSIRRKVMLLKDTVYFFVKGFTETCPRSNHRINNSARFYWGERASTVCI